MLQHNIATCRYGVELSDRWGALSALFPTKKTLLFTTT